MMLKKVLGNLETIDLIGKKVEKVNLEWFELDKRLLRKVTDKGTDVGIVLEQSGRLRSGDILYMDTEKVIAVELEAAEAIVIKPNSMKEMAQVCYQLGNRHLPIFLDKDQVLVPFDSTVVELFKKLDISITVEKRKLEHVLQPTSSHAH